MIKRIFIGVIFLFTFYQGFSQQYRGGLIDKTVAVIGNKMIQLSQIEAEAQMMELQGVTVDHKVRCQLLEQMMESKIYLIQAELDSLSINPEMVMSQLESRVNNVVAQLGGERATEEYFGKSLYSLRQEWEKLLMEQSLVQEKQREVSSSVEDLTPSQVKEFYERTNVDSLPIIPTQYKYSQITKYPSKDQAVQEVKERLLDYRKRILDGERFAVLATLYSQDPGSSMKGGELGMMPKSFFEPAFADAASALQEGQISPIVETPYGFHIIQMIEKEGDMVNVRHILLAPDFSQDVKQAAANTLDSLRASIVGDTISFENAAMIYSGDPLSRTNGGMVADPNTGSILFDKDQLKPEDYIQLDKMKEGDISHAFESTDNEGRTGNLVFKIVRLDKVFPSHTATFENDYDVIQYMADNSTSTKAMDEFVEDKLPKTYIVIDPLFENCDFIRKGWIK